MFPRPLRLTVKDIRYIQRQRQTRFSQHFRLQYIRQYPNKKYHQCSIYIAADIVHRAARRHQLKRQLLEIVKSRLMQSSPLSKGDRGGLVQNPTSKIQNFSKLFLSLNPKNVKFDLR